MGSIIGKAMDENMQKTQEFMLASQRAQMERQMQMQNFMREQQMAMQLARAREMLNWWAGFYGIVAMVGIAGFMKKKPAAIVPLLPLTFIVGYQADLAYGTKMDRIRADAQKILADEMGLLDLPTGLPTMETLDQRRAQQK